MGVSGLISGYKNEGRKLRKASALFRSLGGSESKAFSGALVYQNALEGIGSDCFRAQY